jgi:hypothetical protein
VKRRRAAPCIMAVVVTELIRFPITLARQAINFPYERRWQHTWQQTREAERLVRHTLRAARRRRTVCCQKSIPFDYKRSSLSGCVRFGS